MKRLLMVWLLALRVMLLGDGALLGVALHIQLLNVFLGNWGSFCRLGLLLLEALAVLKAELLAECFVLLALQLFLGLDHDLFHVAREQRLVLGLCLGLMSGGLLVLGVVHDPAWLLSRLLRK